MARVNESDGVRQSRHKPAVAHGRLCRHARRLVVEKEAAVGQPHASRAGRHLTKPLAPAVQREVHRKRPRADPRNHHVRRFGQALALEQRLLRGVAYFLAVEVERRAARVERGGSRSRERAAVAVCAASQVTQAEAWQLRRDGPYTSSVRSSSCASSGWPIPASRSIRRLGHRGRGSGCASPASPRIR